ncbi:hypothetical protein [Litoreibacter janthinus]|uniref:DUF3329 domain-containing protein n=1 Tax=Litoreibacter janthinus TaxID=670154 RepID=A0A1I6GHU6_9RHOB|nr:hypothetical protein [Litoreibacter janthinus]SFR41719.1 hypothetical protein SAMN04488002_1496 [Litoreibacter janthinus]
MKFLDLRHPFFLPLWRRVITVALVGGWGLFEAVTGNIGWAVVFGGAALWCAYEFFAVFDPENYTDQS